MTNPIETFTLPATSIRLNRMGYGAMQLAGPHVFGPPKDANAAIAVLREAIELGVNHIDTSDFYGPYVTNRIIKQALHPYPTTLTIVTKVGAKRGPNASWEPALGKQDLIDAVHSNLKHLGVDALDVVNLRVGPPLLPEGSSVAEPFSVLADLQREGLIRHLGLSTVNAAQVAEAQKIAPVVCVQNLYNVAVRKDDAFLRELAQQGIAYVPYFPLGGFSPLQSSALDTIATSIGTTPMQVALAWLLQRSPNILLIPGTSSVKHLRENLKAKDLTLTPEMVAQLDAIATKK
ncbi:MAG: oxidoreductase [Polyangiaceae bacterium]|nr:oxidoreductase [Polyangiaceae bacterium]